MYEKTKTIDSLNDSSSSIQNLYTNYQLGKEKKSKRGNDEDNLDTGDNKNNNKNINKNNEILDNNSLEDRMKKKYEFRLTPPLKKTCWCVSILLFLGISLIITGIIISVIEENFKSGMTFFILSFIVSIPGGFYTIQFIKAKCTSDVDRREEILSEIPGIC